MKTALIRIGIVLLLVCGSASNGQILIDHFCTDITVIPSNAIAMAKESFHIAYGHTSHGSQLTTGMSGLVDFANGGGKGLSYPDDFFAWNNGGSNGALDLHDYAMSGDVGYYPQWVNNTTNYLNNPANVDVNVVMWSWCGQVDSKYANGTLTNEYLVPMSQLEELYTNVTFVYMTGHVDIWDDENNKAANSAIREYCREHGKVLYDFADIEHYDPTGRFFEFANDNCDVYSYAGGSVQGNWASEWRAIHTEDIDWYSCSAAHSDALNANQKAYAAWWLFARLAGWEGEGIYSEWCNQFFSSLEQNINRKAIQRNSDPDDDGIINLFEQALGLNPREKETEALRLTDLTCALNQLNFSYERSARFEGCLFELEFSDCLSSNNWTSVADEACRMNVIPSEEDKERVDLSLDTDKTNRFYRLQLMEE